MLAKGRISVSGSRYFVTFCTHHREPWLMSSEIQKLVWLTIQESEVCGDLQLYAATIMPDHLHLLFQLTARLPLSRVVAKLKSRIRQQLHSRELKWQRNYFEHRLRPDELLEPFAFYMFMNPYKKGLLSIESEWKGWACRECFRPEFFSKLRQGKYPHKDWLMNSDDEQLS